MSMKSWEREQDEHHLSKRDSQEMAAIFIVAVIAMVLTGLALEAYSRVFA